jgi:hypothetical protein
MNMRRCSGLITECGWGNEMAVDFEGGFGHSFIQFFLFLGLRGAFGW